MAKGDDKRTRFSSNAVGVPEEWVGKRLLRKTLKRIIDLKMKKWTLKLEKANKELDQYDKFAYKKNKDEKELKKLIKLAKKNEYNRLRHNITNAGYVLGRLLSLDAEKDKIRELIKELSGIAEKENAKKRPKTVENYVKLVLANIDQSKEKYEENYRLVKDIRKTLNMIDELDLPGRDYYCGFYRKSFEDFKKIEEMHDKYKKIEDSVELYGKINSKEKLSSPEHQDLIYVVQRANDIAFDYNKLVKRDEDPIKSKLNELNNIFANKLMRHNEEIFTFPPQEQAVETYPVTEGNLNKPISFNKNVHGKALRRTK
ncbi:MAG: hypothetical protein K5769_04935 [Pseudobutyrivibrio sp.]|nr:hypothetical protein [Pseudobutyrivibrio sp.]